MSIDALRWAFGLHAISSAAGRGTLIAIANRFNDEKGACWAGARTLGNDIGLDEKSIRFAVRKLDSIGVIEVQRRQGTTWRITLNFDWQPDAARSVLKSNRGCGGFRPKAAVSASDKTSAPGSRKTLPDTPGETSAPQPRKLCPDNPDETSRSPEITSDIPLGTLKEPAAQPRAGSAAPSFSIGDGKIAAFDIQRVGQNACDAAGLDRSRAKADAAEVERWLRQGWHCEGEIIPAIRARLARSGDVKPRSLAYFTAAISEHVAKVRAGGVGAPSSLAAAVMGPGNGVSWLKLVADYRAGIDKGKRKPFWLPAWGPRPGEHYCHAPREILVQYGFRQDDASADRSSTSSRPTSAG